MRQGKQVLRGPQGHIIGSIRPALPDEAERLSFLAQRSKASWATNENAPWRYDADYLTHCRPELTLTPAYLARATVGVAALQTPGCPERVVGFFALLPDRSPPAGVKLSRAECELPAARGWTLDHLWVDADHLRRGIGGQLLSCAFAVLRDRGVGWCWSLADPNAEAFYRRFGACACGVLPSSVVPRLQLPLLYLRDPFVAIAQLQSPPLLELRYAGVHNFVGRPIRGYEQPHALLTRKAASALQRAQHQAIARGLTLKVYDAYRPQTAVDDFVRWSQVAHDTKMQVEFYPRLDKASIFAEGYVVARSGHSRGSTLDCTLVALPVRPSASYVDGQPLRDATLPYSQRFGDNSLDMGTGFDAFDPASHTANVVPGTVAANNRKLLLALMQDAGFENYPTEWWHFTLRDEPFPSTYFDMPA